GTATAIAIEGRMTTIVQIDDDKLVQLLLDEENVGAVVTIPAATDHPAVIGRLSGQTVKVMETRQALVELQTPLGTYRIPAEQIRIEEMAGHFGQDVNLKDVVVQIEIAAPQPDELSFAEDVLEEGGLMLVVPPVHFSVRI